MTEARETGGGMTDGVRLLPAEMTRADWEMLAQHLPELRDGGTVFEWSLKLLALAGGSFEPNHMRRVVRQTWTALGGGPETFGPFRVERSGRGRICIVTDPQWGYFRTLPRRRRSLARVRAGERTETAADLFNRGRPLLARECRAAEETPIPSGLEAVDPYGENDLWFCSVCGSRCPEAPATGLPADCPNCLFLEMTV